MSNNEAGDEFSQAQIIASFRTKLYMEIVRISKLDQDDKKAFEACLKEIKDFFKDVKSIEEITQWAQKGINEQSKQGIDVLAFRAELEEKISRLEDKGTKEIIPAQS